LAARTNQDLSTKMTLRPLLGLYDQDTSMPLQVSVCIPIKAVVCDIFALIEAGMSSAERAHWTSAIGRATFPEPIPALAMVLLNSASLAETPFMVMVLPLSARTEAGSAGQDFTAVSKRVSLGVVIVALGVALDWPRCIGGSHHGG
jgi:hypothetical protein